MNPLVIIVVVCVAATGCAPKPVVIAPTKTVIERIYIRTDDTADPKSPKSAAAIKAFRKEEADANNSRKDATAEQLRKINETETAAHAATQHLIDKGKHSTPADQTRARNAIKALHDARTAPDH